MEIWLIVVLIIVTGSWLWLTILALLCLFLDPDLDRIQRVGQSVVVILFPFIGATLILHLVNDHSPEVIARFYIPWPFRGMVLNKEQRRGGSGHNGEEVPGTHCGGSYGGNSGSSGDDSD